MKDLKCAKCGEIVKVNKYKIADEKNYLCADCRAKKPNNPII